MLGHVPIHVVLREHTRQIGQGNVAVSSLWPIRRLPRQGDLRSVAGRSFPWAADHWSHEPLASEEGKVGIARDEEPEQVSGEHVVVAGL